MTPDPYKGSAKGDDATKPQTWNRYAYVLGDPINFLDPGGLFECEDPQYEGCGPHPSGPPLDPFCGPGEHFSPQEDDCVPNGTPPPPRQKPPDPQCFAQLKNRDVDDPKANLVGAQHSFWWVQDRYGVNYIISAGPQPVSGSTTLQYLDVWPPIPGESNGKDNISAHTQWSSGLLSVICDQIAKTLAAARGFPNDRIYYDAIFGPNSNSAAHYLARAAGFDPSVPFNFYGWDTEILVP